MIHCRLSSEAANILASVACKGVSNCTLWYKELGHCIPFGAVVPSQNFSIQETRDWVGFIFLVGRKSDAGCLG